MIDIKTWFSDPYDCDGLSDITSLAEEAAKAGNAKQISFADAHNGQLLVVWVGSPYATEAELIEAVAKVWK